MEKFGICYIFVRTSQGLASMSGTRSYSLFFLGRVGIGRHVVKVLMARALPLLFVWLEFVRYRSGLENFREPVVDFTLG